MPARKAKPKQDAPQKGKRTPTRGRKERKNAANKVHCMVVALGASAGGLEVMQRFLDAMPGDSGMAFVLIQHLSPSHESAMASLLARHTEMPVVEIEEGMLIEPDRVYVIPPNRYLYLADGGFHIEAPPDDLRVYMPIDRFFRSLAEECEERAVAVVLSGTGSDGTAGVREVKARSGLTLAQRPDTAAYSGMPNTAVDSGYIDEVLAIEEMPDALVRHVRHPRLASDGSAQTLDGSVKDNLHPILGLLRVRAQQDFRAYKPGMLVRRIGRRMNLHGIREVGPYLQLLREKPEELNQLHADLLIGVTSFFREPESFEALDRLVIQTLVADKEPDEELRIWTPGCASGEEAYSIAILVEEALQAQRKSLTVRIFATDVDQKALEYARDGIYPTNIAADVPEERLKRHFIKRDSHYRVKKAVREHITFAVQNVLSDPPFSKLDLLSCRNLLIYLQAGTQKWLIDLFSFALKPGGYLFLGRSETLGGRKSAFQSLSERWRIFRHGTGTSHARAGRSLPVPAREQTDSLPPLKAPSHAPPPEDPGVVVRDRLLHAYAPPSVLVNRRYKVLYFYGDTSLYLNFPPGEPSYDLMSLAQRELANSIRAAVRESLSKDKAVTIAGVQFRRADEVHSVAITAIPVEHQRDDGKLVLISFEGADTGTVQGAVAQVAEDRSSSLAARLELELQATKEDLQGTIEELETSNEEVMSMNEELQATNEELETSKEELRALNKELTTVNSELQQKVEELESSNDDLHNLLINTHIATLFLDTRFRIKRFTPDLQKLFSLIEADVGRPITDIADRFTDGPGLLEDVKTVLRDLTQAQAEVRSDGGRWYLRRVQPYRTRNDRIRGAVVTFVDITDRRAAELQEREARRYAENVVATVHDGLVMLDADLRVVSANPAFYELFKTRPETTERRGLGELGDGQWDIPQLRKRLEQVLADKTGFEACEVTYDFPRIGRRTMLLNARPLATDEHDDQILLAISDITERTQAHESALAQSERRYRALYDDNPTMYFTVSESGQVLSVNRFGAGKLGFEVEDLIDRSFFELHPEDTGHVQQHVAECFRHPGEAREWETRIEGKNRVLTWVRESARTVPANGGGAMLLVVCEDITETHKLMRQVAYHASHDSLTSLENRREFELRLARVIETMQEEGTENVLCYLDLDQFKIINDTSGHLAGDELLRQIGEVLRSNVRARDTVARLGGDEFGILMENCSLAQGEQVARKCLCAVENFRFRWEDKTFTVGISIGVVALTPRFGHVSEALMAADSACYMAKVRGRNRISVYREDDGEMARRNHELDWLARISDALKDDSLQLSYQPIVALDGNGGQTVHYELLVRFQNSQGRQMEASQFLPTAERYDLAVKLDRWVTGTAFAWFRSHPDQVKNLGWCSINLSGQTLGDEEYLAYIRERLGEGILPPEKVCFEITETTAISNIASAIEFMKALKKLGCLFALDDFGSGFSSFGYLKTLPVDFLKIDGSFVRNMDTEPLDCAMVRSLNEIGQVMGKKTIAEFVERDSVLQKLREIGVDYVQGNMFGAPKPLDAML